jgi:predicted nucleotidyltransferase
MKDTIDPAARMRIDERLDELARRERLAVPLAVESGSRAWGFPSPDSDFDCRFIYVRPIVDHLSAWPKRDVIELPIESDLDINGWDLLKAVRLLAKGNAVVIEWLMSPITYRSDETFRSDFIALAGQIVDRNAVAHHYRRLLLRQRHTHLRDPASVLIKKIFYAVRPAVALRWLRQRPTERIAPMHLPTLLEQCEPPRDFAALIDELINEKRRTRELGSAALHPVLSAFIDTEFDAALAHFPPPAAVVHPEVRSRADAFIRTIVRRFDPGG